MKENLFIKRKVRYEGALLFLIDDRQKLDASVREILSAEGADGPPRASITDRLSGNNVGWYFNEYFSPQPPNSWFMLILCSAAWWILPAVLVYNRHSV